ncbi:MAG: guanylate kinase [Salibacteraceae bacterium]
MNNKAIIFSAPSGAGKTTIVRALLEQHLPLEFSISATSREPRGKEVHGKDYYFLGINGFKVAIENDQLLEWEEVYPDQFYGTLHSETKRIWSKNKAVLFDVDVYGGIEVKKQLGDNAISIFVMPPSIEELERRLIHRGTESDDKVQIRLGKAKQEIALSDRFDVIIVNEDLESAIYEAAKTVKSFLGI